ncbi:MAG TPA: hypothetical protein VMT34_07325, partial [Aggregatilineales bacterium]|nr:hypothetical protein [Aggregatilineales bacterium]
DLSAVVTGTSKPAIVDLKAQDLKADTVYTVIAYTPFGKNATAVFVLSAKVQVPAPVATAAATPKK